MSDVSISRVHLYRNIDGKTIKYQGPCVWQQMTKSNVFISIQIIYGIGEQEDIIVLYKFLSYTLRLDC